VAKRDEYPPILLIDTREQTPFVFSEAVTCERVTLPSGDYSIAGHSDRIIFERKSLPDLVQCCTFERDRFMDQCRRLGEYERGAIVVESTVLDVAAKVYRGATSPRSIIGTVNAVWLDYGVPTFWFGNAELAARAVERMLVRFARDAERHAA
jgi:DNA excision repair protein ERCC-4